MPSQATLLIAAVVVMVYVSLAIDNSRKCTATKASADEKRLLDGVNIGMLVASVLAVLYLGWKMFAPSGYQAKIASYF